MGRTVSAITAVSPSRAKPGHAVLANILLALKAHPDPDEVEHAPAEIRREALRLVIRIYRTAIQEAAVQADACASEQNQPRERSCAAPALLARRASTGRRAPAPVCAGNASQPAPPALIHLWSAQRLEIRAMRVFRASAPKTRRRRKADPETPAPRSRVACGCDPWMSQKQHAPSNLATHETDGRAPPYCEPAENFLQEPRDLDSVCPEDRIWQSHERGVRCTS